MQANAVQPTSRRDFLKSSTAAALGGAVASTLPSLTVADAAGQQGESRVRLKPQPDSKAADFEAAQIKGTIQPEGAYHGVTRLIDNRSGRQFIDSRYSALNLFRLFSVNQGMGQPRKMERTITPSDTAMQIHWPPTEAHQGEITASYEVREPNLIDLTVTVRARGSYPAYEIFLSNYFDKALRPYVCLQPLARGKNSGKPDLVVPMVNDAFRGTVLVFPRDTHAARRCVDGRWDRGEFASPTVQMCPVRRYDRCLAFAVDAERQLAVVLMSHPRHCYAISARYFAEDEADRLTTYTAFDLSLFGDDLVPGDQRTARVRLAVTPVDDQFSQPLTLYRQFIEEVERQPLTQAKP